MEEIVLKRIYLLLCMILLVCCLTICSQNSETNEISKALGIDISGGTIIYNSDIHGGFHGDGYTFIEINFEDTAGESVVEDIVDSIDWNMIPLSDNLQTVVYGNEASNASYGPLVTVDEGIVTIPVIEHGYFYFHDRHSKSNNPKDDTELLRRNSYNFTIALYDIDNNKLYYYELDT